MLSAILALDIAEFSRHIGRDDEATHAELRQLFAEIVAIMAAHDGRVFSEAGDALMGAFASPVEAARAALAIRASVLAREAGTARLHIRQGLALGDVIVDEDRVYGDAVNIAARLQALAEPDGLVMTGSFHEQVRRHVTARFRPAGRHQLKNIEMPVEVLSLDVGLGPARARLGHIAALAAGLALLLAAAAIGYQLLRQPPTDSQLPELGRLAPLAERGPSIAVVPFETLGDDERHRVLAEGVVEDITTDLSRISRLQVIARNTTRAVAQQQTGPRAIANSLGVSHVLEGTVRTVGDRLRINARLVDGGSGRALWGERYDVTATELFGMHDAIVHGVIEALALDLSADERLRITRHETTDIAAYENFRRGWEHLQAKTPDDLAAALAYLRTAVAIDSDYAAAHAAIGQVYWWSWVYGWEDSVGETWETAPGLAQQHLQRALLQPNAVAYQLAADMNLYARRFDEAIGFARLAVEHDPNDVAGHVIRAETLIYAGRPVEGRPWIELAMRLDPLHPAYVDFVLGMADFGESDFENAVAQLEKALERNPEDFGPAAPLAAALFHLGRHEAAKAAFDLYMEGWPEANLDEFVEYWPYQHTADEMRLTGPLRALGMPQAPPS